MTHPSTMPPRLGGSTSQSSGPSEPAAVVDRAHRRARSTGSGLDHSGWLLLGLVVVGGLVRATACLALWPTATTLSDAGAYAADAAANPLADPQHPAGYGAFLALLGTVTRNVGVTVLVQHGLGVAAAVLLFAAVRRLVGSPWPALVPASVVLLDTDEIFLEHSVMSETLFLFVLAFATFASVRAIDAPRRSQFRWAALGGGALAAAAIVRSAGLFAIPFVALAMGLAHPPHSRRRWHASALFLAVAAVALTGYAVANFVSNGRFELTPTSGWHLYARVGRFADCTRFTPPKGTAGLCERTPPVERGWGPDFYLYASASPARQLFGPVGSHDDRVGSFAAQAILHEPAQMADAVWVDVRRYYVPSSRPHGWYTGWDIDPQLEWRRSGGAAYTRDVLTGMRRFFDPFVPRRDRTLLGLLNGYEQVFGFGATLLSLCTLLTLLGLVVGPRRHRVGVLVFGVGGLAQLVGPTAVVLYMGRYTIPVAGLIAAGAAISVSSLVERVAVVRRIREDWGLVG